MTELLDAWDYVPNTHCAVCEVKIDYSVNQKINIGWTEQDMNPWGDTRWACGLECSYDLALNGQYLTPYGVRGLNTTP